MREINQLINFAEDNAAEKMILATIVETTGSTYRKAGARKLISSDGKQAVGLLSGGCLEGEIIRRALSMVSPCERHTFDTTADMDRFFGYAVGCQGSITVEFKRLLANDIARSNKLRRSVEAMLDVFVVGAGPDIDPLYELLVWSGWNCTFFTCDSDILSQRQNKGWPIQKLDFDCFSQNILTPEISAVLLMSHNYPTDLEVLSKLLDIPVEYIGILGPKSRHEQLLADLQTGYQQEIDVERQAKIYGPMGLHHMGRGESAIALAIVAELQQIFFGQRG